MRHWGSVRGVGWIVAVVVALSGATVSAWAQVPTPAPPEDRPPPPRSVPFGEAEAGERHCHENPEPNLSAKLGIVETCFDNDEQMITYTLRTVEAFAPSDVELITWELDVDLDDRPDAFLEVFAQRGELIGELATNEWRSAVDIEVSHEEGSDTLEIVYPIATLFRAGFSGGTYGIVVTTEDLPDLRFEEFPLESEPQLEHGIVATPAARTGFLLPVLVLLVGLVAVLIWRFRARGRTESVEADPSFETLGVPSPPEEG